MSEVLESFALFCLPPNIRDSSVEFMRSFSRKVFFGMDLTRAESDFKFDLKRGINGFPHDQNIHNYRISLFSICKSTFDNASIRELYISDSEKDGTLTLTCRTPLDLTSVVAQIERINNVKLEDWKDWKIKYPSFYNCLDCDGLKVYANLESKKATELYRRILEEFKDTKSVIPFSAPTYCNVGGSTMYEFMSSRIVELYKAIKEEDDHVAEFVLVFIMLDTKDVLTARLFNYILYTKILRYE